MNYNIDPGRTTEAFIDQETALHCLTLLSTVSDATTHAELWPVDAGVWNNVILKATTPDETYYFKKYREFAEDIPNYSPPYIPTEQRAEVAQIAQIVAADSFVASERSLVPAVLATDSTAFIMEAVPHANQLLDCLSSGSCPESIVTVLPIALANFHSAARSESYMTTALSDTRFRDYKVDLQYHNIAKSLDPEKGQILQDFAEWYKQQQDCIAHGDLNSKNVLVTPNESVYVIDFEQAHLGTPAYDLAFILSELFIAEIQHKQNPAFQSLCQIFAKRYLDTLQEYDRSKVAKEATLHLAAQVIYRFKGPSHKVWTSYVSNEVREEALERAVSFITEDPQPITEIM